LWEKAAYKIICEDYIKNLLTTNGVIRDKKEQVIDGQNQSVIYTYELQSVFVVVLEPITKFSTKIMYFLS
jgi:hypothetical protein